MQNNLDYKLNRVETSIDTIKHNLALEPTAPIEDVVTATEFNLKKMMNIFIQQEEPETKDGIWIKSEPFEYEQLKVDESYVIEGTFVIDPDNNPTAAYKPGTYGGGIQYKDDFYFITGAALYYFDKNEQTIKEIPEFKTNQTAHGAGTTTNHGAIINDILYMYTNTNIIHTFNLTTYEYNTFETPLDSTRHFMFAANNKVFFVTDSNNLTKQSFCIDAKTHKLIDTFDNAPGPLTLGQGFLPFVGGQQLLVNFTSMGNLETKVWFDPVTYKYTNDNNRAMGNFLPSREKSIFTYSHYLYYTSGDYLCLLDLNNPTSYDAEMGVNLIKTMGIDEVPFGGSSVWIWDNKAYMVDNRQQVCATSDITTPCEENTLILQQGQYKSGGIQNVALYSVPVTTGKIVWPIRDVAYYKDGKYNTALTVYYGNGTSWNKLK